MKKIFYILTSALLALTACNKEMDWKEIPAGEMDSVSSEGASIDLIFGIPSTPRTRGAMDNLPDIQNDKMHVAVFDGSGSLKQYQEAEYVPVTVNGSEGKDFFKVNLNLRNSEVRLHFIVNGPAKETVTGGMESALMQEWVTDYPNAAYWQRIVLPEGITAYAFSEFRTGDTPWVTGDYIHFYYREYVKDGATLYDHISQAVYEANYQTDPSYKHLEYRISISTTTNTPYYTAGSQTVNVGDFVNARGEKILDGTGYFQSATITDAVASVPLVRNFARLKIRAGAGGNFTPTQYYLMNIPNKGSIAPYSATVGGFATQYAVSNSFEDGKWEHGDPLIYVKTEGETESHDDLVASLTGSRYPADIPSSAEFVQTMAEVIANGNEIPETWESYPVGVAGAELDDIPSAFLYERGLPNKNQEPTYLLIGGELDGYDGLRWFKVELTDGSGKYFRVFRDLTYFLEIGNVEGSDGSGSAGEAALSNAVSDISSSLATENLDEVSDGRGTSIRVEYISAVRFPDDPATKTILFKVFNTATGDALEPLVNGESRYSFDVINNEEGAIMEGDSYVITDSAYDDEGPDGKTDWRVATVTLSDPSTTGIKHGELVISGITSVGETSGKTLSRTVKYSVMTNPRLTLEASTLEDEAQNRNTRLSITLPTGLGFSMFPLILKIEAEKENLNPDNARNTVDLPVDPGISYFNGKNSFGFLFTINYTDYYDRNRTPQYNQTFNLWFKTTKDHTDEGDTGSNETYISVTDQAGRFFYKPESDADFYDTSKNFAIAHVDVENKNRYFDITVPTASVSAATTTATFTVKTNGDNGWRVTGGTGITSISPATGTGNGVVTLTFDPNVDNQARTLTATVTPDFGDPQTVQITQRRAPYRVQRSGSAQIDGGDYSNNGNNQSTTVNGIRAVVSNINARTNDQIRITQSPSSITFTPVPAEGYEDMAISGITFTVSGNAYRPETARTNNTNWTRNNNTYTCPAAQLGNPTVLDMTGTTIRISSINVNYTYYIWTDE